VNLLDPTVPTRRCLLERFRAQGWRGRIVWLPIPVFALAVTAVRFALGLAQLRLPARLAVWSIFRPRRYDTALSARVLEAAGRAQAHAQPALETQLHA